jgi:hypothetical protein
VRAWRVASPRLLPVLPQFAAVALPPAPSPPRPGAPPRHAVGPSISCCFRRSSGDSHGSRSASTILSQKWPIASRTAVVSISR